MVGDIDTGLDFTHPDLAPNYDAADSRLLERRPGAGRGGPNDVFGHGTHTAGTIAAAQNGIGIVGVAPHVRIAGIKSGNAAGFFFPEMVVCSFMWAATHGIDVTNNSYFADPWLFNCKNDAEQRAIWSAEQRAINFAKQQGVVVVAAAGNSRTTSRIRRATRRAPTTRPRCRVISRTPAPSYRSRCRAWSASAPTAAAASSRSTRATGSA